MSLPLGRLARFCSIFLVAGMLAVTAHARPATTKLLPKTTEIYFSIPDIAEVRERVKDMPTARMLRDPQVRPLAEELYGQGLEALAKFQDELGMPVEQLLEIPQGEVCAALVTVREEKPSLVVIMDVGADNKPFNKLLEAGLAKAEDAGIEPREEKFGETKVTVLDLPGEDGNKVLYCVREETLVVTTNPAAMAELLKAWDGDGGEPLSSDEAFAEIRDRARGTADEAPHVIYFADPIGIFRAIGEDNAMVRLGESFLNPLGLDGLRGLGGAITLQTEQFESVHRATVLITTPRRGIVELIATRPGDTVPESWVPANVASYMTINWDFLEMYDDLRHLVDSFRGDGAFSDRINKPFKEETGVDLELDLLPYLEGRFSMASSMTRPVTLTSQTAVYGFKLTDPEKVRPTVEKIAEHFKEQLKKENYGAMTFYQFSPPNFSPDPDAPAPPMPCFGILGDYLLIANQRAGLEQAVRASEDASQSLASTEDFQLIKDVIQKLPGGEQPTGITFARPEESLRFLYELANSEQTRKRLSEQGEQNEFFRKLNETLEKNPLPPFEVISKYYAPAGALIVDEESGWQYIDFTLKRPVEEDSASGQ